MILLAMDRAPSVRRFDAQGFLHIETTPISKANICPYRGSEIPGWQALGLDADRIYRLLRDPEELARAAPTFNNLPLLSEHVPVDADTIPDNLIIGSTGSDCAFDGTYLRNSQVVWKRQAIRGILSNRKKENSCGYRYRADMTSGKYDGLLYDGVMRDIVGNHVTLVTKGRAGSDVVVGDEKMKLNSRTGLLIGGALAALVRPMLATDAAVDITDALGEITGPGMADSALAMDQAVADNVLALVTPHLAQGQTLTADDIKNVISAVPIYAQDDDISEPVAEPAARPTIKPAAKPGEGGITQAAMDSAIAESAIKVRAEAQAESTAIRIAEKAVLPFVGELPAMDSAAAYYEVGLKHFKVDISKLAADSYGPTFDVLAAATPKSGERIIAQDARPAGVGKLGAIVPNLKPAKVI